MVNARDRFAIYSKDSDGRRDEMIQLSNKVMSSLGDAFSAQVVPVISLALEASRFIRIFLDELFFIVLAVLSILSVILVTSLLLSDTEEKTFEYGILRSIGFRTNNVVILLCFQSFLFALPGILLGLLICYMLYVPIGYALSSFIGMQIDLSIEYSAVVIGVTLGLALPIIVCLAHFKLLHYLI